MRLSIDPGLAAFALLALAACNKPAASTGAASSPAAPGAAPASGAAPVAAAAASAPAAGPLSPEQIPHRKPGLWRQTIAMDGQAPGPGSTQLCVDEASEAKLSLAAQRGPGGQCPPPSFSRNLDGSLSFSGSCAMGGNGKSTTAGTIKGDFSSGYTTTMTSTITGSPVQAMNGQHSMTITATWTGPCAPGQKGGDMIFANGMKRNVLEDGPPAPPPPAGK